MLRVHKNLGTTDRVIRGFLGFYLLFTSLSLTALPLWGHLILAALGVGLFAEALTGY